jgi:hypothetical protein
MVSLLHADKNDPSVKPGLNKLKYKTPQKKTKNHDSPKPKSKKGNPGCFG